MKIYRLYALALAGIVLIGLPALVSTAQSPDTTHTGPAVFRDLGGDRLVFADGGALWNGAGAGAIGVSSTGFSLAEGGLALHQTVWTFDAIEIVITDAGAAGAHGKIKLYDFPAGYIEFLGSTIDLDVACGTDGLTTTATYDMGVGTTTSAADAALATTEQNVINKIEGDLSSSAAALGAVLATDAAVDGTGTALDLYFNIAFEANDASADDVCTATGTIRVAWINLGDY